MVFHMKIRFQMKNIRTKKFHLEFHRNPFFPDWLRYYEHLLMWNCRFQIQSSTPYRAHPIIKNDLLCQIRKSNEMCVKNRWKSVWSIRRDWMVIDFPSQSSIYGCLPARFSLYLSISLSLSFFLSIDPRRVHWFDS